MLKKIEFSNFKSLKNVSLELSNINILAGGNAAGKSSIIQGILLAKSASESSDINEIELNGPYNLSLGRFQDVLCSTADIHEGFSITLYEEIAKVHYAFYLANENRPYTVKLISPSTYEEFSHIKEYSLHYLNSERLGPRKGQKYDTRDKLTTGFQGEFVNFAINQADLNFVKVPESIKNPLGLERFSTQVEAWMQLIVNDFRLKVDPIPEVDMFTVSFGNGHLGRYIPPTSTGFGISYCLPIVTAGLLATTQEKPLLIVENPEAHLHPFSQSRIGKFLALISLAGVQVIIETHSEHVVNGVRLQLAERKQSDKGKVHFITQMNGESMNKGIGIKSNGELSNWPKGFFDQEKNDLFELLKIKRRGEI